MHTTASRPDPASLFTDILYRLRRFWTADWQVRSDATFALIVSAVWIAFYNVRFWTDTLNAMWHGSAGSVAFLGSLIVLVWCLQASLLLLLPSRRSMIGAASIFFVVAAASSYFSLKYGVVMNKDMLRNVFETDAAESQALLSIGFVEQVVILGVIPALLVWKVRLPAMRSSKRLRKRAIAITVMLGACGLALLSTSASYAVFLREHKPIRYTLMPIAPVTSALSVLFDKNKGGGPAINVSGQAQRTAPPRGKPLVIVLVVGETARAENFQLGGYARPTNPSLAATNGVIYFPETTSCGTATAISVPCMFSHLPRSEFNVDDAAGYMNLLDALQQAGLGVEWRDNNAGCKGVCARVKQVAYPANSDPTLCRESYCYDEIMLKDLGATLESLTNDTVIVMHQIGSHGPAYAERYPPEFEKFKPACRSNQLQRCTPQEIVNAYDNTIVYTDHVLGRAIETLRGASSRVDSMLLYVSDHGESLGEQGLYLHGLPYSFAPDTQKHVPLLMWLSPTYVTRTGVSTACVREHASEAFSHDNVYHTVMGAAEVRNASYNAKLDILEACREQGAPRDHE
jgi:lipid A ethanolaminephosphotransferase